MPEARAPQGLLDSIRCAIHGQIDLKDASTHTQIIRQLVVSEPMQRLRRIKQLGFASLEFTGADHSRFSHAIGTLHVMRMITKATREGGYLQRVADELSGEANGSVPDAIEHLLVAALLQDCGELPYALATSALVTPAPDVLMAIEELCGESAATWPVKAVFTVACLIELDGLLGELDLTVLAYLMTGRYWKSKRPALHPAMQLLDGVLDADRIDYVLRDAHHTGQGRIDAETIIASIESVDDQGVICSDPAPPASLLALRAHLYSTVYLSGPNRFRVMLLRELLQTVTDSPHEDLRADVFKLPNLSLTYEQFLDFDDVQIERFVSDARSSKFRSKLGKRAVTALDVLSGKQNGYRVRWLDSRVGDGAAAIDLPSTVFGEAFEDSQFADQRTLRVRLEPDQPTVELQTLDGPYARVIADNRAQLPLRGDVLVYEPAHGRFPNEYKKAQGEGYLGAAIKAGLSGSAAIPEPDTRDKPGFNGPRIFISYQASDIRLAAAVVAHLHRKARRYYILAGTYQGVGGTPGGNSEDAPKHTDACIMLATPQYQRRLSEQPNGNIMRELVQVGERRRSGTYPTVPLSTLHYTELDRIPWPVIGFEQVPFTGTALDPRDGRSIEDAVDEALQYIDRALGHGR